MKEKSQVMRGIRCNENVIWEDPVDHAFRAVDALAEVKKLVKQRLEEDAGYWIDEDLEAVFRQAEWEIENLYHSFYM